LLDTLCLLYIKNNRKEGLLRISYILHAYYDSLDLKKSLSYNMQIIYQSQALIDLMCRVNCRYKGICELWIVTNENDIDTMNITDFYIIY